MTEKQQRKLLDPYRTMGSFVSGSMTLSQSYPHVLTVPTQNSFKIYSTNLSIKVNSPSFVSKIKSAISYNQYTYLRTQGFVIKMRYHHIVKKWQTNVDDKSSILFCFQNLIILVEGKYITLIDEKTSEIIYQKIDFNIKGAIHPISYINKLLLYSQQNISLVNVISDKILYNFPKFISSISQTKISIIQSSPIVDVVAVGLQNGIISFLNLKKDQIIFSLKQKSTPISLAFSQQQSWMASGDINGNAILWDLQNKKIIYKFQNALKGPISSLLFIPGLPVLNCCSIQSNSIRQLKINLQDNKIMTLYRQRLGTTQNLDKIVTSGSNDLIMSSFNQTMYMSFHSHCNNYLLPRTLDSKLPYHIVSRNFDVQLYKGLTIQKKYKIHEQALVGKISISNRFFIVVTRTKVVKLGGSTELAWPIPGVKQIVLFNEHYVYLFTPLQMIVCDFNTPTICFRKNIIANKPSTNVFGNLLAFQNQEQQSIQIWDMSRLVIGRKLQTKNYGELLSVSFTSDNRFIVTSHKNKQLLVWNLIEGEIYKQYRLDNNLLSHSFTLDNQFFVSIFQGDKHVCVWNNYIGRLVSNRNIQLLNFKPQIKETTQDFREYLSNQGKQIQNITYNDSIDDILDQIPDAQDAVSHYMFNDINRWMPLVYYDQIKNRNTPDIKNQQPSLPFFLDFKNLTQEKKKIQQQMKKQAIVKKREYLDQKDKFYKKQIFKINLQQNTSQQQYVKTYQILSNLNIGEIDYQIRSFLLIPGNFKYLLKMMKILFELNNKRQQIKNIILNRILTITSEQILSQNTVEQVKQLQIVVKQEYNNIKQKLDRCIVIAQHKTI